MRRLEYSKGRSYGTPNPQSSLKALWRLKGAAFIPVLVDLVTEDNETSAKAADALLRQCGAAAGPSDSWPAAPSTTKR